MNSSEIDRILSNLFLNSKTHYLGVFPSDKTPSPAFISAHCPACYVANTDQLGSPGTHWVAFYHKNDNTLEFFDSFGHTPSTLGFLLPITTRISHNPRQIQSGTSKVCGCYSIYFLYYRSKGTSMECISQHLSKLSHKESDSLVYRFVQRLKNCLLGNMKE